MKSQDFLDKLGRIDYRTDFDFNIRVLTQYFAWYFRRQKRYLNLDFTDRIQVRFIHEAVSYLSTVTQENNGEIFILLSQYLDAIKTIPPFPDINSYKYLPLRQEIFRDCSIIYRAINNSLSNQRYDAPLAQLFFAHDRFLEQKARQFAAVFWTDDSSNIQGEFSTITRDTITRTNVLKRNDRYILFFWNPITNDGPGSVNNIRIELFKDSEVTIKINGNLKIYEAVEVLDIAIDNWLYKLKV